MTLTARKIKARHGQAFLQSASLWAAALLLLGFAEEFPTLSRGTGFWLAAVLLPPDHSDIIRLRMGAPQALYPLQVVEIMRENNGSTRGDALKPVLCATIL